MSKSDSKLAHSVETTLKNKDNEKKKLVQEGNPDGSHEHVFRFMHRLQSTEKPKKKQKAKSKTTDKETQSQRFIVH